MKDPATPQTHCERDARIAQRLGKHVPAAGSPDKILLVGFKSQTLKPLTGKTLAEIARMRGTSPKETVMDLILEDGSPISAVYFSQSEDNCEEKSRCPGSVSVRIQRPWLPQGSWMGTGFARAAPSSSAPRARNRRRSGPFY